MNNVIFENNLMEDCGYGKLCDVGPLTGGQPFKRCAWLSYDWGVNPVNLISRYNTIIRCYKTYRFHDSNNPYPTSWVFSNNDIRLASGTAMDYGFYGNTYTINNAASWAALRNTEVGSTFTVL